jgi:DNA-directed RNA polymerase subunit RPC12/RpoP
MYIYWCTNCGKSFSESEPQYLCDECGRDIDHDTVEDI